MLGRQMAVVELVDDAELLRAGREENLDLI